MSQVNVNETPRSADTRARVERNKKALYCFIFINVIIAGVYLPEVFKGTRTLFDYLVIFTLSIIPTIIASMMLKKRDDSYGVKYMHVVPFCIMYGYIMMTTTQNLTFSYILLVFTIITLYVDIKFSILTGLAGVVINLAYVGKQSVTIGLEGTVLTDALIMLCSVALAATFSIIATNTIQKIALTRMKEVNDEKNNVSEILSVIVDVSEALVEDVDRVAVEMERVAVSVNTTKSSMEDVATGSNETAEAIQTQQENTEEINHHIASVKEASNEIVDHVQATEKIVLAGQSIMQELTEQAHVTEETSKQVAQQMEQLKTYTDDMQSIMELINNVASQTGLLALNASIEAARAGEAGRGFAVVATEISNLSSQTSTATGDIDEIIANIAKSLDQVVESVTELLESNARQNVQVTETAEKFNVIQTNTRSIFEQSSRMNELVETVSAANTVIVESITNISAITEEVTARSTETLDGTRDDLERIEMIVDLVKHLDSNAQELKRIEESR